MNLAFLSMVSVSSMSSLGCLVIVRALKSIVGAPKIFCLDSERAGQSIVRWSAVSSIIWR